MLQSADISHGDNEDITEWFEDAESEVDWITGIEVNALNSSTVCSLTESLGSMTLTDKIYERNMMLEKQCKETEQKYQNLKVENQKLVIQLANESHRASKYHRKLQYIQDHHEVFSRLKQAYLSMKYNEATGRPLKEINEAACQTWKGILCENCIESAKIRRIAGSDSELGDAVAVSKSDFHKLQQTVSSLGAIVEQREKSWSFNLERENNYKAEIVNLQSRIQFLDNIIAGKSNELGMNPSNDISEIVQKQNQFLKGIIINLEKKYRDITKKFTSKKVPPLLNDQEKLILGHLIKKYDVKLTKRPQKHPMSEKKVGRTTSIPVSSRIRRLPRSSKSKCKTAVAGARSNMSGDSVTVILPPLSGDTRKKSKEAEYSPKRSRLTV